MPPDYFPLLGRFADYLAAKDYAARTIASYADLISRAGRIARKDPRHFTSEDVASVLASYPAKGPAKGQMMRALHCFYEWAEYHELLVNPAREFKIRKPALRPAPYLDRGEITRLLIAATQIGDKRAPWGIMLAYATGARVGSLCGLTSRDVRGDRATFRVAKGDRPYSVPLGHLGREAVRELRALADYTPSGSSGRRDTLLGVGPGRFWQWVHSASAMSGVEAWPHLLRHSAATQWARSTDPGTWAALMNHADLSQYKRYVGVSDERLREAVESM